MSSEREPGVDELMGRVRQEVERRRLEARMHDRVAPTRDGADEGTAAWQAMHEAIGAAEPATVVGMRLPPMSEQQGLRRRIAVPVARLILRAAQLVTRDQSAFNRLILELVRMLTGTVHERMAAASAQMDALASGLAQAMAQSRPVPELVDAGARTASELRALRESLAGVEGTIARLEASVADMLRASEEARRVAVASRDDAERLRAESLRAVAALDRRLATLGEQGGPAAAPAGAGGAPPAAAEMSDAFYVSFEDRFRGSREQVKARASVYLPIVVEAGAGSPDAPVLDVGCGRGEWLEVLAENGLAARGIDRNATMAAESRARGLDVVEADVLAHLRSLPDGSLGAVTGMHVLEHLDFATIVAVLDECNRVLRRGGVAIFETPNPRNLLVGACQFWIDPTHRAPLHPDTMAFVAASRGLDRVRILPLHPVEDSRRLPDADSPAARALNEYLFGPQDFAVVAYRP